MARLSCLTLFEPGAIASSSGNVVVPTLSMPFPATVFGTFAIEASITAEFAGAFNNEGLFAPMGSVAVAWTGSADAGGDDDLLLLLL